MQNTVVSPLAALSATGATGLQTGKAFPIMPGAQAAITTPDDGAALPDFAALIAGVATDGTSDETDATLKALASGLNEEGGADGAVLAASMVGETGEAKPLTPETLAILAAGSGAAASLISAQTTSQSPAIATASGPLSVLDMGEETETADGPVDTDTDAQTDKVDIKQVAPQSSTAQQMAERLGMRAAKAGSIPTASTVGTSTAAGTTAEKLPSEAADQTTNLKTATPPLQDPGQKAALTSAKSAVPDVETVAGMLDRSAILAGQPQTSVAALQSRMKAQVSVNTADTATDPQGQTVVPTDMATSLRLVGQSSPGAVLSAAAQQSAGESTAPPTQTLLPNTAPATPAKPEGAVGNTTAPSASADEIVAGDGIPRAEYDTTRAKPDAELSTATVLKTQSVAPQGAQQTAAQAQPTAPAPQQMSGTGAEASSQVQAPQALAQSNATAQAEAAQPQPAPSQGAQVMRSLMMTDREWPTQLTSMIKEARDLTQGDIEIALQPERLGRMTIRMEMRENTVAVTIVTDNDASARLLNDNQARLADLMAKAGLEMSQHNASSDQQGRAQAGLGDQNGERSSGQSQSDDQISSAGGPDMGLASDTTHTAASDGINILA